MKDYWVLSHSDPESPPDIISKLLDLEEIPWATKQLWAPDATEKDGKYYLYFPAKDSSDIFRLGVAVSDKPDGQFVPEPSYIPGSYSIDPAVLHDEDDSYHIYFGGLSGGQLQAWNNNEFNSSAIGNFSPQPNVTAIGPRYAKLGDDLKSFEGEVKEIVLIGEDGEPMQTNNPHRFFEGPAINKIDGLYYLSYSTGPYHTIDMAVGTSVDGPFIWNSTILEPVRGCELIYIFP
jgi:beta-xylosidase